MRSGTSVCRQPHVSCSDSTYWGPFSHKAMHRHGRDTCKFGWISHEHHCIESRQAMPTDLYPIVLSRSVQLDTLGSWRLPLQELKSQPSHSLSESRRREGYALGNTWRVIRLCKICCVDSALSAALRFHILCLQYDCMLGHRHCSSKRLMHLYGTAELSRRAVSQGPLSGSQMA